MPGYDKSCCVGEWLWLNYGPTPACRPFKPGDEIRFDHVVPLASIMFCSIKIICIHHSNNPNRVWVPTQSKQCRWDNPNSLKLDERWKEVFLIGWISEGFYENWFEKNKIKDNTKINAIIVSQLLIIMLTWYQGWIIVTLIIIKCTQWHRWKVMGFTFPDGEKFWSN